MNEIEVFEGTKGKWEVRQGYKRNSIFCRGRNILSIGLYDTSAEKADANAKLMATSPELLEDLQEAIELIDRAYKYCEEGNADAIIETIRDAKLRTRFKETINKALGYEE